MDLDEEKKLSVEKENEIDPKKLGRIEKEKKELLVSLAGGDFSTQKAKVAAILNLYPEARNSDITLSLKYWETFQSDIYNESGILPKDLFKLERLHYIVRARAKIQNEYGLFQSDDKVRKHRKKREEVMYDAVLEDVAPRKVVNVYSDETGKNDDFVIVASVWVLTGRAVFTVSQALSEWKKSSLWANREIHFTRFGKKDLDVLKEYLGVIKNNREYLSFKVIAIERSKTRRKIAEVVEKLHEHMLVRGAEHEIQQGRIDLPREIEMTVDDEQSLDSFTLSEMRRRVMADYERSYGGTLKISDIQSSSSRNSPLVQLADLIAGAVNRSLNHTGEKNYKDEMAELVVTTLDIALNEEGIPGLDVSALFRV
ncbi:MAG: DUF3800 domain-containing protein [Methylococcales bacterium]|nr:DUF3800 domain-containing protein [Methylococcales bacterium]MDD5632062.1 DUF3800 domain-containing protein [Methylococcales bacterium]